MNHLRSRQLEEVTEVEVTDIFSAYSRLCAAKRRHSAYKKKGALSLSAWLIDLGPLGVAHAVLF
jgi:hypothetical protein